MEKTKAFRLADNKTGEPAGWGVDKPDIEPGGIADTDMGDFCFDLNLGGETNAADPDAGDRFDRDAKDGDGREDGNDEYDEFAGKFKPKKTTDGCHTPDSVREAVAARVS